MATSREGLATFHFWLKEYRRRNPAYKLHTALPTAPFIPSCEIVALALAGENPAANFAPFYVRQAEPSVLEVSWRIDLDGHRVIVEFDPSADSDQLKSEFAAVVDQAADEDRLHRAGSLFSPVALPSDPDKYKRPESLERRAVGLLLWDAVHIAGMSQGQAVRWMISTYLDSENPVSSLGTSAGEPEPVLRRWYREAARCIQAGEVL